MFGPCFHPTWHWAFPNSADHPTSCRMATFRLGENSPMSPRFHRTHRRNIKKLPRSSNRLSKLPHIHIYIYIYPSSNLRQDSTGKKKSNLYAPCMVYLPTVARTKSPKCRYKYTILGAYGTHHPKNSSNLPRFIHPRGERGSGVGGPSAGDDGDP